jgi:hypothetical protein
MRAQLEVIGGDPFDELDGPPAQARASATNRFSVIGAPTIPER